jgi:hypothetical protein
MRRKPLLSHLQMRSSPWLQLAEGKQHRRQVCICCLAFQAALPARFGNSDSFMSKDGMAISWLELTQCVPWTH